MSEELAKHLRIVHLALISVLALLSYIQIAPTRLSPSQQQALVQLDKARDVLQLILDGGEATVTAHFRLTLKDLTTTFQETKRQFWLPSFSVSPAAKAPKMPQFVGGDSRSYPVAGLDTLLDLEAFFEILVPEDRLDVVSTWKSIAVAYDETCTSGLRADDSIFPNEISTSFCLDSTSGRLKHSERDAACAEQLMPCDGKYLPTLPALSGYLNAQPSYNYAQLRTYIIDSAETKSISILGFEFDRRYSVLLGPWIVAGIQLYLLLYLNAWIAVRSAKNEILSAWIGAFPEKSARFFCIFTIVVLPIVYSVFVAILKTSLPAIAVAIIVSILGVRCVQGLLLVHKSGEAPSVNAASVLQSETTGVSGDESSRTEGMEA